MGKKEKEEKIQLYAIYKEPTSTFKKHTDWNWRNGKRYSKKTGNQNKVGLAMLTVY